MSGESWIIVGASRGIGLEFVRQLLDAGEHVVAAVRNVSNAPKLHELIAAQKAEDRCIVEQCDVSNNDSITVSTSSLLQMPTFTAKRLKEQTKMWHLRSSLPKSKTL
jgi:NAD(P)-dependent dehydrogenase (short-subunit alcohol dehydrogenase family)